MTTKYHVDAEAALFAVARDALDKIAASKGLSSRHAPIPPTASKKRSPRRRVTGRNQQFNIKAKAETIEEFYVMADRMDVPLGELLERALAALKREGDRRGMPT